MIESAKLCFFLFLLSSRSWVDWVFGGDDFCEAVLFCCLMLMVAFILGLRKLAQPCRNFLFLLPFHARHSGRTSRRYWSCLIETLILILGFLFARLQYLE